MTTILFEDWNRGGRLFEIRPDQIALLGDLAENPVRPWVDGVGLDSEGGNPLLLTAAAQVLAFLGRY